MPVLAGNPITLRFDGCTLREHCEVSGSSGCHTYTASYRYHNAFSFSPHFSTEMAYEQRQGIMEQERMYLARLKDVVGYCVEDELRLETADDRALVFTTTS